MKAYRRISGWQIILVEVRLFVVPNFPSIDFRFGCLGWGVERTWFDESGWVCEEAKQQIQPYNWSGFMF